MIGLYFGIGLGALIFALIAVIIIRTFRFTPPKIENGDGETVVFNEEKAFSDLSKMIKCKTVSNFDPSLDDETEFDKFKLILRRLFPKIYENCEYREIGKRALLYRYRGKNRSNPLVLMSHFDVVSVEESAWQKPPFDGIIEDGVLWGRGTLDTKGTLNAAMQALETLISQDFVPENDIYLAFGGNEEVNGSGAPMIVDLFERLGITPSAVLDEGGAVVENVFPGIKQPCALIGIAEKGMLNVSFSFNGNGGHSSSPKPHTPVGKLSAACVRVENRPFKFRVSDPTYAMLNRIARYSTFLYKMIFANLWCFSPLLDLICKNSGGELNALHRTTCAFTQMEGSKGMNVIPASARMVANLRILPGETPETALEYLKKTVNDDDIRIEKINSIPPSRVSVIEGKGWDSLCHAISSTWEGVIVSPYLMFACSDSRHWGRISDRVYRFSPMALTKEDRASIHGNDERISFDVVKKSVEFYIRFIKQF